MILLLFCLQIFILKDFCLRTQYQMLCGECEQNSSFYIFLSKESDNLSAITIDGVKGTQNRNIYEYL